MRRCPRESEGIFYGLCAGRRCGKEDSPPRAGMRDEQVKKQRQEPRPLKKKTQRVRQPVQESVTPAQVGSRMELALHSRRRVFFAAPSPCTKPIKNALAFARASSHLFTAGQRSFVHSRRSGAFLS